MGLYVLVMDYAWPPLEIERDIPGAVGAELVVAQTGHEEERVQRASKADALLTNGKPVTPTVLNAAFARFVTKRSRTFESRTHAS